MKNFKKVVAIVMATVMVFGTTAMAAPKETAEDAYKAPLPSETSKDDKILSSDEESWAEIIPEASEEFYLNDFAGIFSESQEVESEEEAKEGESKKVSEKSYSDKIVARASEYEEENGVKVVISIFSNFEDDISAQLCAYLTYQLYDVGPNGIVLVVSAEDKTGAIFAQNKGDVVSPFMPKEFEEVIQNCFKEGNDLRKALYDSQEVIISAYEEIVSKFNEVYVQDERELFTEDEREEMISKISDYATKSGIDIVVATTENFAKGLSKYGNKNAWIYISLSDVEGKVDVVISKEAKEYITTSMAQAMLERVSENLSNEEYAEGISFLIDDFINRLEEQKASAYTEPKLETVSLEI